MGALLKKHALDSLLEKAAAQELSPTDKALTEKGLRKSQKLCGQITNGIYRDMPKRMEYCVRKSLSFAARTFKSCLT